MQESHTLKVKYKLIWTIQFNTIHCNPSIIKFVIKFIPVESRIQNSYNDRSWSSWLKVVYGDTNSHSEKEWSKRSHHGSMFYFRWFLLLSSSYASRLGTSSTPSLALIPLRYYLHHAVLPPPNARWQSLFLHRCCSQYRLFFCSTWEQWRRLQREIKIQRRTNLPVIICAVFIDVPVTFGGEHTSD